MNLTSVIEFLGQRIGLANDALGTTTLERAVTARMQALRLNATEAYAACLAKDEQELPLLLDRIAVAETWFFRGGEVFDYLARRVAQAVCMRGGTNKFRILSVPCSTGEEPYSLAIALAEAGVPAAAWEIQAVDLSAANIERATRGRFSHFSFRQTPADLRDRYFRPVEGGWELDPAIRARVRFRQGNLLDPLLLRSEGPFDLCFCRNLFIYLHADARRQALDTLCRLLAPDGWLCTGHAEPLDLRDTRFTRSGPAGYFLYRRANPPAIPPANPAIADIEETKTDSLKLSLQSRQLPQRSPSQTLAFAPETSASPADLLSRAREQADTGRLSEALASCQDHLSRVGPSANLYSLIGVIHQARQESEEAVRCYRKALYLEPAHVEALAQLLLLYQEKGDDAEAQRLRSRLERVAAKGDA